MSDTISEPWLAQDYSAEHIEELQIVAESIRPRGGYSASLLDRVIRTLQREIDEKRELVPFLFDRAAAYAKDQAHDTLSQNVTFAIIVNFIGWTYPGEADAYAEAYA